MLLPLVIGLISHPTSPSWLFPDTSSSHSSMTRTRKTHMRPELSFSLFSAHPVTYRQTLWNRCLHSSLPRSFTTCHLLRDALASMTLSPFLLRHSRPHSPPLDTRPSRSSSSCVPVVSISPFLTSNFPSLILSPISLTRPHSCGTVAFTVSPPLQISPSAYLVHLLSILFLIHASFWVLLHHLRGR